MKKRIIIILSIILVIIVCLILSIVLYKNSKNKQETKLQEIKVQERYNEIREDTKKAVERNIKAMYPNCSISKEFKETDFPGPYYNSSFLINNGYIKKSELLDVDNESYCDVYVDINPYYEAPLNHQQNCEIYYKIYLKCQDYKEEGYINWG